MMHNSTIKISPGSARWLSVFFLLITATTSTALQSGNFVYSTNNNEVSIDGYLGPGGIVAIPSSIGGEPVTTINSYAFYNTDITEVIIPDSTTFMGLHSFQYCYRLTNVVFGTGMTTISSGTFGTCTNLTRITIPDSVSYISSSTFSGCSSLTGIVADVSNVNYSSVNGVLFNKDLTQLIRCPEGKTGSYIIPATVTEIMSRAFSGCASLTNITIPDAMISIGSGAFKGCNSLGGIVVGVSNVNYSSVSGVLFNKDQTELIGCPGGKTGGYIIPDTVSVVNRDAFYRCVNLINITIPDSVGFIHAATFSGCSSLTGIVVAVSNANYSSVNGVLSSKDQTLLLKCPEGMGGHYSIPSTVTGIFSDAFSGCASLATITIPDSVGHIQERAFNGCASLTKVTIPDSVSYIGIRAFSGCSSLTGIVVGASNANYSSVNGILFDKDQSRLIRYPGGMGGSYIVPDTITTLDYVFYGCANLTEVTIPDSVSYIGQLAFYGCSSLTRITIPQGIGLDPSAFSYCTSLREAYFEGDAFFAHPDAFAGVDDLTIYYSPNTSGWGPLFAQRRTVPWNPSIQTSDESFGVQAGGFGFEIAESESGLVVVETTTNILTSGWIPVQTNSMASGTAEFRDSEWDTFDERFYRLSMP